MFRFTKSINKQSFLHRWNIVNNDRILNCFEKMEKCHSMKFEDYSICPKKTILPLNYDNDKFKGEDVSVIALTLL